MNKYAHQDLVIRAAQDQRAAQARALITAEQERRDLRQRAYSWVAAEPAFRDLDDSRGEPCHWLVMAALQLRAEGRPVNLSSVRDRRDQLFANANPNGRTPQ